MAEHAGVETSAANALRSARCAAWGRGKIPRSAARGRSVSSLLVEALCILPLVVIAVTVGCTRDAASLPALLSLAFVTPRLVATDLREHRLPNQLVAFAGVGAFTTWLLDAFAVGSPDWAALLVVAVAGFVLLLFAVVGGLGMGDVKLGAVLAFAAALLDPSLAPLLGFLAVLVGGAQSACVLVWTRDRRRRIPFGPALLSGYWLPMGWLWFAML